MIDPNLDGITHINIYSKAKTLEGRLLSNFYPFKFTKEGYTFGSVEAYWYWLGIDCANSEKESLCLKSGFEAKYLGRELKRKYGDKIDQEFEHKILSAIWTKLKNNTKIILNMKNLPLEHYYIFGNKIYDVKNNYPWMIEGIQKMINYIKNS